MVACLSPEGQRIFFFLCSPPSSVWVVFCRGEGSWQGFVPAPLLQVCTLKDGFLTSPALPPVFFMKPQWKSVRNLWVGANSPCVHGRQGFFTLPLSIFSL